MRVKRKPTAFLYNSPLSTYGRSVKLFLTVLWIGILYWLWHAIRRRRPPFSDVVHPDSSVSSPTKNTSAAAVIGPCAILLYGLPRQFQSLVLPGMVQHVLRPNRHYECDYFVHSHNRSTPEDPWVEARGADVGRGGPVRVAEIFALPAALEALYDESDHREALSSSHVNPHRRPKVQFVQTTDEDFLQYYQTLLPKLHTARWHGDTATDATNRTAPLYLPTSEAEPFSNATLDNILKMWLGQEAVWKAMEASRHYSRVAMLRNDMLYVTPIDIYRLPPAGKGAQHPHPLDVDNRFAVIPGGFGNHPVNDRMIYGPYDAVRIWATGRLSRLREHVHRVAPLGHGIHDEQLLQHSIFPAIRHAGIPILLATTDLCFLRVRSDQSIRVGDCGRACVHAHNHAVIEALLQRTCRLSASNASRVAFLECPDAMQSDAAAASRLRKYPTTNRSWRPCAGDS